MPFQIYFDTVGKMIQGWQKIQLNFDKHSVFELQLFPFMQNPRNFTCIGC